MIQIKKLEKAVRNCSLLAYDIGEITKIEKAPTMDSANMKFFDSKGPLIVSSARIGRARDDGFCTLKTLAERKDVYPEKYQKEIFTDDLPYGNRIVCNDPRVLWADIVTYWAFEHRKIRKTKDINFFLTKFLPSYEDAVVWLKENEFPVFATQRTEGDPPNAKYRYDFGALKVPPKIDWSEDPDRE